jgi:kynurenine formamidase
VLASSFGPTLEYLLHDQKRKQQLQKVAAIASIDYRLSRHPEYPQDIATTPPNQLRNAVHPDHIADVRDALHLLCEKYALSDNYVLVGHSVGATMAFWLSMRSRSLGPLGIPESLPMPRCIVGVAGIYNIRALVDNHAEIPIYRLFVSGALGPKETDWDRLSPTLLTTSCDTWPNIDRILLAHSPNDGLVETSQTTDMEEALKHTVMKEKCAVMQLEGAHDEIWETGTQLGLCILAALDIM